MPHVVKVTLQSILNSPPVCMKKEESSSGKIPPAIPAQVPCVPSPVSLSPLRCKEDNEKHVLRPQSLRYLF